MNFIRAQVDGHLLGELPRDRQFEYGSDCTYHVYAKRRGKVLSNERYTNEGKFLEIREGCDVREGSLEGSGSRVFL